VPGASAAPGPWPARLRAFEHQYFEQPLVVVNGYAPFVVVVLEVKGSDPGRGQRTGSLIEWRSLSGWQRIACRGLRLVGLRIAYGKDPRRSPDRETCGRSSDTAETSAPDPT
jgi:hypothetical protein